MKKYMKQLQDRRREVGFKADVYSQTGKRNRINALGECVLSMLGRLHKMQAELKTQGHELLNGSLVWGVDEQRVKDTDGKKGFHYTVFFMVKTDEPYYTSEEIAKEMRETYEKLKAETEEMYGETTDQEYLDALYEGE